MEAVSLFKDQNQNISSLERVGIWMHEHPGLTKVSEVGGLVLGAGGMVSAYAYPMYGLSFAASTLLSGVLFTASTAALLALDLIVWPHHDMKQHVYTPGKCEGGELYYEGDVPVLSLDADDPFKAGKAQGYLCGEAIDRLSKRFSLMMHTLGGQPSAQELPRTLAAIRKTIPAEYLLELEGMVEGYNRWSGEQPWWSFPKKLALDDALLLHLMPDSIHFHPGGFEFFSSHPAFARRLAMVACTAIVDNDPQDGFVFARNMDWPSFGLAGTYSLVINRRHANGLHSTAEVSVPGFVGTLTGMNDQGLSLAMNVCGGRTHSVRGMPAAFYNRACLEGCQTVKEVEAFVQNHSPLGPYHLTVADPGQAESIHFYQCPDTGRHLIRRWEENKPLVTLNSRYHPEPCYPMHHSEEREAVLEDFFERRGAEPLASALSCPYVNNYLTAHRVVMKPETGELAVAFDNAYAGRVPLQPVSVFYRAVR